MINPADLPPGPVCVAVSGGGDSMALLHLVAALKSPFDVYAVTVDHGLRDVQSELDLVAGQAAALGVAHRVLRWTWDGQGNLQARARDGRRAVIADWAQQAGIRDVLLGHTRDDQAETVLMRIVRGSGVDGLAGMAAMDTSHDMRWHRPLLATARSDLRAYLRAQDVPWAEDPSNQDPRFDRVRVRQMMSELKPMGLSVDRLVQTADHARAARGVLDAAAQDWMADHAHTYGGDVLLDRAVCDLASDTHRRVVARVVQSVGRAAYRPRWSALRAAIEAAQSGRAATLAGTVLICSDTHLIIGRELAAVPGPVPFGQSWDGWRILGPETGGRVGVLADGIAQIPDWRDTGMPRRAVMAGPAIWDGDRVVGAPLVGMGPWCAQNPAQFNGIADRR